LNITSVANLSSELSADFGVQPVVVPEMAAIARHDHAHPLRVLIVEDEPLVSHELADIVEEALPSIVFMSRSVRAAKMMLDLDFDFALLDISVTDGKTYEIATILDSRNIPYAFVSGSQKVDLPNEFSKMPFIVKPVGASQIRMAINAADMLRRKHQAIASCFIDEHGGPAEVARGSAGRIAEGGIRIWTNRTTGK
jgi:two-component SAPR family response regulator